MRCLLLLALPALASTSLILLQGGTVVNHDSSRLSDVLIEGGVIREVGLNLSAPPGTRLVDATGKLVIPGGIETHAHLSFPRGGASWGGPATCDDALSGHGAAAAGGTTTGANGTRRGSGALL